MINLHSRTDIPVCLLGKSEARWLKKRLSKEIKEIIHSCGSYQVQGRDEIIIIRCFICGKVRNFG